MRPGLSDEEAAALFAIETARLREFAAQQGVEARGWEPNQVKRLALRLILYGHPDEQASALRVFEALRQTGRLRRLDGSVAGPLS